MAINITSLPVGIYMQSGNGVPTHISPKGTEYTDLDTAIVYINKDGVSTWAEFLDSTFVITGGTGSYFTGGTVTGPTVFINGLTANTISATTYVNLPKVLNGGGEIYYFNLSEIEGSYFGFKTGFSTAIEQISTITIPNGTTDDVAGFLTMNSYPNSPILPGGVWSFYINLYKEDSLASFDVFCEVYKVNQSNTETLLFSTNTNPVNSISPISSTILLYSYFDGTAIDVDDRILVKIKATNTGSTTKTVTLVTEGSQNYSYCVTSFSLSIDGVLFDGGFW